MHENCSVINRQTLLNEALVAVKPMLNEALVTVKPMLNKHCETWLRKTG